MRKIYIGYISINYVFHHIVRAVQPKSVESVLKISSTFEYSIEIVTCIGLKLGTYSVILQLI